MNYLKQLFIIIAFSALGEICHYLIPWPIPASIYGMVLLFVALLTKVIKVSHVKETGSFLVKMLPVMFVVPLVSLIQCWDVLKETWLQIAIITVISTVVTFAAAGVATKLFLRRNRGGKNDA